ncbi:MAG: FadR family transcriptional regulator [Myxococcales bacterium]|nr:FadR family transcriptional regulator [Myxococcales bacterium]
MMASIQKSSRTLASDLERKIAVQILRGERSPSSRLPPVRALAAELDVTVPTIQRVIDRLEATGLVSVRRGSGVTVNDPHACGELSLLPMWFDALSDQPEVVCDMLCDFLELRRVMATHLIRTRAERIRQAQERLLKFSTSLRNSNGLVEVAEVDLTFTAAVVEASQHFAAKALFHTTEALVREVPWVAEALYGDRSYYRRVIGKVMESLAQSSDLDEAARAVDRVLIAWDRRTVSRFRTLLEASEESV